MNNPYVIRLDKHFHTEDRLDLYFPFYRAGDLSQKIKHIKQKNIYLTEDAIWMHCFELSSALKYIHSSNILHRDIKPNNIFINDSSEFILADFGLSIILNPGDFVNETVGTPLYSAPEVLFHKFYTTKIDIWSLGLVLYELCCHNRLFDVTTMNELMKSISNYGSNESSSKLEGFPSFYSDNLQTLIKQMICVDPKNRPDANEIYQKFDAFDMMIKKNDANIFWDGIREVDGIKFVSKLLY